MRPFLTFMSVAFFLGCEPEPVVETPLPVPAAVLPAPVPVVIAAPAPDPLATALATAGIPVGQGPQLEGGVGPGVDGRMRVQRPATMGGLQNDEVYAVMRAHVRSLERCAGEATGELGVSIDVDAAGRVTEAEVTQGDPVVATCIARQVKSWRFRPVKGGTASAILPFTLLPH